MLDSKHSPFYNPDMRRVVLLTSGPVGQGAKFRAVMGRGELSMLVTLVRCDRPHCLTSQITSRQMDASGTLTFRPDPPNPAAATVMAWDWQVTPKGWLRLLGPAFAVVGARMERRIWAGAKAALEASGSPA